MAAQLHLHLFDYDVDADGTYTLTPQVGLATSTLTMHLHNHGDAPLIVTGAFANIANVTIAGDAPDSVLQPDETLLAEYMLTPGYGAFSFDLVLSSNDPVTPTLTVTFEGMALAPPEDDEVWTAQRRRRDWSSQRRMRHWSFK